MTDFKHCDTCGDKDGCYQNGCMNYHYDKNGNRYCGWCGGNHSSTDTCDCDIETSPDVPQQKDGL